MISNPTSSGAFPTSWDVCVMTVRSADVPRATGLACVTLRLERWPSPSIT